MMWGRGTLFPCYQCFSNNVRYVCAKALILGHFLYNSIWHIFGKFHGFVTWSSRSISHSLKPPYIYSLWNPYKMREYACINNLESIYWIDFKLSAVVDIHIVFVLISKLWRQQLMTLWRFMKFHTCCVFIAKMAEGMGGRGVPQAQHE